MLMVRRHATVILKNASDDMDECLAMEKAKYDEAIGNMPRDRFDMNQMKCLSTYKETLKNSKSLIEGIYDGYQKNYGTDGNLIDMNYFKQSKEYDSV